jgi:hypothetical protein
VIAAGQVVRSRILSFEDADQFQLLLNVTLIGSPAVTDTITVSPIYIDTEGLEYVDKDTTYGTVVITGTTTPLNIAFKGPALTQNMGLKITGAGALSSVNGFMVSAYIVQVANTTPPSTTIRGKTMVP